MKIFVFFFSLLIHLDCFLAHKNSKFSAFLKKHKIVKLENRIGLYKQTGRRNIFCIKDKGYWVKVYYVKVKVMKNKKDNKYFYKVVRPVQKIRRIENLNRRDEMRLFDMFHERYTGDDIADQGNNLSTSAPQ